MTVTRHGATRRTPLLVSFGLSSLIILLFAGCASMTTKPVASTPAGQAPPSSPTTPGPSSGAEAELAAAAREAEAARALGLASAAPATDPLEIAPDPSGDVAANEPDEEGQPAEEVEPSPLDELPDNPPEPPEAVLEREKNLVAESFPGFDIPMVLNDRVVAYVDYFSTRHKLFFDASLTRSGRYVERFQDIFEEAGIPKDLVYMAHVESAFKTNAYSRAKAKGIFQFISGTGRRYGLRIDGWVDERSDPEKSARAAAAYLKDLYGMFGDWYLALAAYNAGEGKIQRSLVKTGKNDFWSLASTKSLRVETRNYVPAILAAALIAKQPAKYGFNVALDAPIPTDVVRIEGQTDLRVIARLSETDVELLRQLNPQLRRGATPPGGVTDVRVPAGRGETTTAAYEALPKSERMVLARHQVSKGESLGTIARHYGVTTTAVAHANGLQAKAALKSGQELVIPAVVRPASGFDGGTGRSGKYRVQRGDTLSGIARRYRTSATAIAEASGISVRSPLRVGQRLVVPARTPRGAKSSATIASAGSAGRAGKGPAAKASSSKPVVHTVRAGETLYRIAGRYQVSVDTICALNNIAPNGVLYPGTRLTIRSN
jgi:membrane-bound lytic murein transglycosylase D